MRADTFGKNWDIAVRLRKFWLLFPLLFAVVGIHIAYASSEKAEGIEKFRQGRILYQAGRYAESAENFLSAKKEFPVLADYALYYLSEAYHKLDDHARSLEAIRSLIAKYPSSPLMKKARMSEIREIRENSDADLSRLYEAYVRDYPDDGEAAYLYGIFLKQAGEDAKALAVFKKIYIRAGAASRSALGELSPGDITAADLNERALNLIRAYEFREAERDLRKALAIDDGKLKHEILNNLGQALFKQKEYKEAAVVYDSTNDGYQKARSLYRAGDKQGFDKALQELLLKNDRKAGSLLLAVASDKRRARDFEEALRIYQEVNSKYPGEAEESLWGTGWTFYGAGDYRKAAEVFAKLYARYGDPRHLYWQARSIERLGEDAGGLYRDLGSFENNFYSAIASARHKETGRKQVANEDPTREARNTNRQVSERIEALVSLGMTKEAVTELASASRKIDAFPDLVYSISKFQELGEFKRSIELAVRMPYSAKVHRFWYPLAFWDDVEQISLKHELDPLVALSVMREESRFDADARSVAGARGLMQIMPQTAYRLDKTLKLGIHREVQINDVRNNIALGTFYLKTLFREFKLLPKVLAAYNAGEQAVREWEQKGNGKAFDEFIEDIPYAETRNYVKKVITSYFQYRKYSESDPGDNSAEIILGKL